MRCRGARAYVPIGGAGAVLAQKILSQAPAPLPANSAVSLAMEDVIAGCLEKDRSQRRQRVQNAMIELKLAGRSLPRSGEAHRRLPERPTPAPVAAASGTTHGPLRPAPRITVARPSVAPYAAQGSETIYGLSFTRRTWVIGGAMSRIAHFGKQGDAYDIFVRAARVGSKAELMMTGTDKKLPTDSIRDYLLDNIKTSVPQ